MSTKLPTHAVINNVEASDLPITLQGNYTHKGKVNDKNSPFVVKVKYGGEVPPDEIINQAAQEMGVGVEIIHHTATPRAAGVPGTKILIIGLPKTFNKASRDELLCRIYSLMVSQGRV